MLQEEFFACPTKCCSVYTQVVIFDSLPNLIYVHSSSSSSVPAPFPHLDGLGPSVVRVATDAAPRWIIPASRARSRNLEGRPGRRVLHGVLLRSQGVLRVVLLLHCIGAIRVSVFRPFYKMKLLVLVLALSAVYAEEIPPSCDKPVYCDSKLLHAVQLSGIFEDSKTFVDLELKNDANTTLAAFDDLLNKTNNNPTKPQIEEFVDEHFSSVGELDNWTPPDYNAHPAFLAGIRDERFRDFGKAVNDIWPILGRKVKSIVFEQPDRFSLIPVHNGFIIPGGRFTELYYWDTYWIIEGLLVSGMHETVKGVIKNLLELVKIVGHVPNGSRWYYKERSQPPLLSAMMSLYIRATNDIKFLKENIEVLEEELEYWLDTQLITFNICDRAYTLLRYNAPSAGPRPESYYEDYTNAQNFDTKERQQEFYTDLKSAAESGWDFSTRWFINKDGNNNGTFLTLRASKIIPVDLNAIFANALKKVAHFQALLHNRRKGAHWAYLAKQWRNTIKEVLWNNEDGIWYDWDLENKRHRKFFYPSNVAPLWMGAVDKEFVKMNAPRILDWLVKSKGLDYPGGIPTSLIQSGEQWDFPNAWPPLVSLVVNALEALETKESVQKARKVAQTWLRACLKGFSTNKQMFEKYDVVQPGKIGGGGEYNVQTGFGWSNGVVLEFLAKYGRVVTSQDSADLSVIPANLSNNTSA
ncbi:jg16140 [Pararge aegeria aegeria]|uniref:Trehalase n=1 Tax=Pararge aegeria aegeria TaxID=348720 RepID=A0A8S4RFW1_9NEOP|nr:jg16140 [Pararge aegeria aegeria]